MREFYWCHTYPGGLPNGMGEGSSVMACDGGEELGRGGVGSEFQESTTGWSKVVEREALEYTLFLVVALIDAGELV